MAGWAPTEKIILFELMLTQCLMLQILDTGKNKDSTFNETTQILVFVHSIENALA